MSSAQHDPELLARLQAAIDAVPAGGGADAGADSAGAAPSDSTGSGVAGRDGTAAGHGAAAGGGEDEGIGPSDPDYRKAKTRAYNMLAARDHSRAELERKLLGREHAPEVVSVLLDRLEAAGLLDDERYAHQLVRAQRTQRGLSKRALAGKLREKGVPEQFAQEAIDEVDDEYPLALELAKKKAASTRGLDPEKRLRRTLGVLGRRGFPSGLAMRAAREAIDADDAEIGFRD